jgi:hypothetical protein
MSAAAILVVVTAGYYPAHSAVKIRFENIFHYAAHAGSHINAKAIEHVNRPSISTIA